MTELVFRGTFESKDSQLFMKKLEEILKETNTEFRGRVLQFEVSDYTEYEEIKEEMCEQTSVADGNSSGDGPNEGQGD